MDAPVPRSRHTWDNGWTPLSQKPCWKCDVLKLPFWVWYIYIFHVNSSVGRISWTGLTFTKCLLLIGLRKSLVNDLISGWSVVSVRVVLHYDPLRLIFYPSIWSTFLFCYVCGQRFLFKLLLKRSWIISLLYVVWPNLIHILSKNTWIIFLLRSEAQVYSNFVKNTWTFFSIIICCVTQVNSYAFKNYWFFFLFYIVYFIFLYKTQYVNHMLNDFTFFVTITQPRVILGLHHYITTTLYRYALYWAYGNFYFHSTTRS